MVDELQTLAGKAVTSPTGLRSLVKTMAQVVLLLEFPVAESGTQMDITSASSQPTGIGKHVEVQQLLVVGDFESGMRWFAGGIHHEAVVSWKPGHAEWSAAGRHCTQQSAGVVFEESCTRFSHAN